MVSLKERIHQKNFVSSAQEAVLNIMVTSAWLNASISKTLTGFDITPSQYNVLRILRGAFPEHLTCSTIGERLLDRTPDVTRLLDRLERAGYLVRHRAKHDRRVVEVAINEAGLELLSRIDPLIDSWQESVASALTAEEFTLLSSLLDRVRSLEDQEG